MPTSMPSSSVKPRKVHPPVSAEQLEALAHAAGSGDGQAFEDLVRATIQGLTAAIAARAPSAQILDEVIQETYVAALEQLPKYVSSAASGDVGRGGVLAWLRTIGRNKLVDEFRRRNRQAGSVGDRLADLAWIDPSQDAPLEVEQQLEHLAKCLNKASPLEQEILQQRYVQGQALHEIARRMKRKRSALAVQIFRLRENLRRCIERQLLNSGLGAEAENG